MGVAKGEKAGLFQRIKRQYRGMTSELKKVHWPNRKEIISYTTIVLISVIIVAVVIWLFDSGIGFLMNLLLK